MSARHLAVIGYHGEQSPRNLRTESVDLEAYLRGYACLLLYFRSGVDQRLKKSEIV